MFYPFRTTKYMLVISQRGSVLFICLYIYFNHHEQVLLKLFYTWTIAGIPTNPIFLPC